MRQTPAAFSDEGRIHILFVEDDPDDRLLLKEAFGETASHFALSFVNDGEALLDFLYHRGEYREERAFPPPDLILLDLNLPKKDGREVLAEIKSDGRLRLIPVVVFTTSRIEDDILFAYNLGAASYIIKPDSFEGLWHLARILGQYWFGMATIPSRAHGGGDGAG